MTRVDHHYAKLNGTRLHYVEAGSGPPVVLLHGFPETHRSWDAQIPTLVASGRRVVAPDLRGYGESDRPRAGYDLDTLADDVAALIQHLGAGAVDLVGHDWGGAIGWHTATRHPERVRRLVVVDCPHPVRMLEALKTNPRQLRRSWYMLFFQLPLLPELWLLGRRGRRLERFWRNRSATPRSLVAAEREALRSFAALRGPLAYYRTAFRANARKVLTNRTLAGYRRLELPVTVIWGAEDRCLGVELSEGHERFARDLRVRVLAGAGHFVHQERPDALNALLLEALALA